MNHFLGLQVNQAKDRIFINQEKYFKKILKKFSFEYVQSIRTPNDNNHMMKLDDSGKPL